MAEIRTQTKSIMLAGVGGQGTILAAKILSEGLTRGGYDVKMSEIHGMSQRGGSVTSHVRYGENVYSPVIAQGKADIICSFEKLEAMRCLPYLKPGGTLIVNDYELYPLPVLTGSASYPERILESLQEQADDCRIVPAHSEAAKLGNSRAENILLLGVLIPIMGLDEIPWEDMIRELVKQQLVDINLKAFALGRTYQ